MAGIIISFSIFGMYTIEFMNGIDRDYYEIIEISNTLLVNSSELSDIYGELRRNVTRVAYAKDTSQELVAEIEGYCNSVTEFCENYLDSLYIVHDMGYDMTKLISMMNNIVSLQAEYHSSFQEMKTGIDNDNEVLLARAISSMSVTGIDLRDEVSSISVASFDALMSGVDRIKTTKAHVIRVIIALFLTFAGLSTIMLQITSRNIRLPIEKLKNASLKVADGDMDVKIHLEQEDEVGDLSRAFEVMIDNFEGILLDINSLSNELEKGNMKTYKIDESKYKGVYRDVVTAVNNTVGLLEEDNLYAITLIEAFGEGKFDNEIKQMLGDKIHMTNAVTSVQDILTSFVYSINNLTNEASNGKFVSLDTSQYKGSWVSIVEGLNKLTIIIEEAMDSTKESLTAFSQGDFSYRSEGDAKGIFKEVSQLQRHFLECLNKLKIYQLLFVIMRKLLLNRRNQ